MDRPNTLQFIGPPKSGGHLLEAIGTHELSGKDVDFSIYRFLGLRRSDANLRKTWIGSFTSEVYSHIPHKDSYRKRITELLKIAKEENTRYNKTSEIDFWYFVRRFSPFKPAGLILTDDGNLIATWDDNNNNYFDIEFLGDKTLEYVAFNDSDDYEEGSGTIDDALRCVYRFNLESLLGINMKQATIERNHNVVRYVGGSKINPITGNISRAAFKLREDEIGISVNWLEYFADTSKHEQLRKVQADMIASRYSVGPKGTFAELNVGETTDRILEECGIVITFGHKPRRKNRSHALLLGLHIASRTAKSASVVLAQLANKNRHPVIPVSKQHR